MSYKVEVFDMASAPKGLLRATLELRNEVLNKNAKWGMPSYQGMEFDDFDNPSTKYLVVRGENGTVLGTLRIAPTKFEGYNKSMVGNVWPQGVDGQVPAGEDIYEASRIAINPALSGKDKEIFAQRREVIKSLVLGAMELALKEKVDYMIGVMQPEFWQSVFIDNGWDVKPLGDEVPLGYLNEKLISKPAQKQLISERAYADNLGDEESEELHDPRRDRITVCKMPVSQEMLQNIREKTGIETETIQLAEGMLLGHTGIKPADSGLTRSIN